MAVMKVIDPVTRLEGHLKIEVKIDTVNGVQQVVDTWASGTLFRGFESILVNRDPRDAQHITQRICGVCPVSHGMAAVLALDAAANITVPSNARIMRNLVLASNFIQSHILHFYHLTVPDFVDGPNMPPWQPSWKGDKRFDAATTNVLVGHYVTALEMRRKAHEMGALFGGRLPDPPAFLPGGITTTPRADRITKFKAYLNELVTFINNTYIPDAELLGSVYDDYYSIGKGYGNLLAFGVFDLDSTGNTKLLGRGQIKNGSSVVGAISLNNIVEHTTFSNYANSTDMLKPKVGETKPQYPKANAYSWLKAPRHGAPFETGALARMWVNGDYQDGISVMDRHVARAYEARKIASAMQTWINQLVTGQPYYTKYTTPTTATSVGLTEAPRGALGHWLQIAGGKIAKYQIITPTCWNASPRDANGKRGPIEQALIGTPVANVDEPVEVMRVIHAFDPCLSCAVHVMRPSEKAKIFTIGHYHGEEEIYTHEHADGSVHSHDHNEEHSHE
ncbi:MAG: nickel-dependent hydrogenase large subunit [Armatimonadota bacterium]